jgi:hypothetical protein
MPPAILLMRFGWRGWPLPLPFFLIWPLVLLAAFAVALLRVLLPAAGPKSAPWRYGWIGLRVFCQLHGTKVDIRSNDGARVYLSFV